jgi:hypothetical protein
MPSKNNAIDIDSMSGAGTPEIEVTSAMIEAGISALSSHWTGLRAAADGAIEEAVRDVLHAAGQVRLDQLSRR